MPKQSNGTTTTTRIVACGKERPELFWGLLAEQTRPPAHTSTHHTPALAHTIHAHMHHHTPQYGTAEPKKGYCWLKTASTGHEHQDNREARGS